MTNKRLKITLFTMWIIFFIMHCGLLIYLHQIKWIEKESLFDGLKVLNGSYSPYLGAMLLFFWSKPVSSKTETSNKTGHVIILITSFIWNVVISFFLFPLLSGEVFIQDQIELIQGSTAMFAWIIAGAFGYFFAKE